MPAVPTNRRRVELVLVPIVAAFCMAFIIGAIVLDRDQGTCPPANWNNQLTLSLTGSLSGMTNAAAVTACTGADCTPMEPISAAAGASKASAASAALQTGENSRALVLQKNGSWLLNVGTKPPRTVNFSVFDKDGNVLASQSTALNWTRVAGTERCGGRMAGMNVVIDVP